MKRVCILRYFFDRNDNKIIHAYGEKVSSSKQKSSAGEAKDVVLRETDSCYCNSDSGPVHSKDAEFCLLTDAWGCWGHPC